MEQGKRNLARTPVRYLIEACVLSALAVATVLPWGCGHSPTRPEAVPTLNTFFMPNGVVAHPGQSLADTEVSIEDPPMIPIYIDPVDTTSETGIWKDTIDVSGGVIDMDVNGEKSYFFIPTAGIEEKLEIRVTMYRRLDVVDKRITEFHFEPEGLTFRAAAMLSYCTTQKDGDIIELTWWSPDDQKWMRSAEAVVVAGYVTFPVYHFSDYRISERVSLGGQKGAK